MARERHHGWYFLPPDAARSRTCTTPEQFAAFVYAETAKFGEIIAKEKLQMGVN